MFTCNTSKSDDSFWHVEQKVYDKPEKNLFALAS